MHLIVRPPSAAFPRALSRHAERHLIDADRAIAQHNAFVAALREAGAALVELPPAPAMPDAPFVSDTILALPAGGTDAPTALLIATRPAETSRRAEVESVVACARQLVGASVDEVAIPEPGTLEGGDVILLGDRLLIGVSARTNEAGASALATASAAMGYRPFLCPVTDRLHLATAVTAIGPDTLIGTAVGFASVDAAGREAAPGPEVHRVVLPDDELAGANVLALGDRCLVAAGNPTASAALRSLGLAVVELELDEFWRADGGPTCLVAIVP